MPVISRWKSMPNPLDTHRSQDQISQTLEPSLAVVALVALETPFRTDHLFSTEHPPLRPPPQSGDKSPRGILQEPRSALAAA